MTRTTWRGFHCHTLLPSALSVAGVLQVAEVLQEARVFPLVGGQEQRMVLLSGGDILPSDKIS